MSLIRFKGKHISGPRVDKLKWKAIGVLVVLFWVFGIYFGQLHWFSLRTHEIRSSDLSFENSLSQDGKAAASLIDDNGFLGVDEASQYCGKQKWSVFPDRDQRRKVYDLVMVNTELDWLEIRLNELHNHVDYFVILESATTFTGHTKHLSVQENWHQFQKFHDQIIYHVLENPPSSSNISWDHERHQRDAMYSQVLPSLTGIRAPNYNDVILVSDLDEIPRPATLTLLRNCEFPRRLTLRSRFYYYGFQWLHHGEEWAHPQATIYQGPDKTILPSELRKGTHGINRVMNLGEKADLWNAAWHCSCCFSTIGEMLTKMSSFSHVELNKDKYRQKATIVDHVRRGKDLWDRLGQWYQRIENNEDIPEYLKKNRDRFRYMLDRDALNGGFIDFKT